MPLDQQGWRRPDYKMNTSVVGVVSKSMMLRLRDPCSRLPFSLSLACCATEQPHSRYKEKAHTQCMCTSHSCVVAYHTGQPPPPPTPRAKLSRVYLPQSAAKPKENVVRPGNGRLLHSAACRLLVTRRLGNTQCPRSARTVPAQCPRQCPPGN